MGCQALKLELDEAEADFGETGLVHVRNLPEDYAAGMHFTGLPGMLLGISSEGKFLYRGDLQDAQEQTVNMRKYGIPDTAVAKSWALFANGEDTFCLTSWYPAITIGRLTFSTENLQATCEPTGWTQDNVPRIFSFLEKATNGAEHHGEYYFLFKWRRHI